MVFCKYPVRIEHFIIVAMVHEFKTFDFFPVKQSNIYHLNFLFRILFLPLYGMGENVSALFYEAKYFSRCKVGSQR